MKTDRIREKIKKFLGAGPRNTAEILEHVNSTMRHGTNSQQLGNVLSKDKDIVKVGYIKRSGILSGGYDICEWATRTWVSSNCPGWEEGDSITVFQKNNEKYDYAYDCSGVAWKLGGTTSQLSWDVYEDWNINHDAEFTSHSNWVESWNALLAFRPSVIKDRTFEEYFDLRGEEYGVVTELDKYKFVSRLGDYCVYKNTIQTSLPGEIADRDKSNETKRLLMAIDCYRWTIDCIQKSNQSEKYIILEFMITNNLGLTYLILKQFDEAEDSFHEAKNIMQNLVSNQTIPQKMGRDLFMLVEDNEQLLQERRGHKNRPKSEISYLVDEFELDF